MGAKSRSVYNTLSKVSIPFSSIQSLQWCRVRVFGGAASGGKRPGGAGGSAPRMLSKARRWRGVVRGALLVASEWSTLHSAWGNAAPSLRAHVSSRRPRPTRGGSCILGVLAPCHSVATEWHGRESHVFSDIEPCKRGIYSAFVAAHRPSQSRARGGVLRGSVPCVRSGLSAFANGIGAEGTGHCGCYARIKLGAPARAKTGVQPSPRLAED